MVKLGKYLGPVFMLASGFLISKSNPETMGTAAVAILLALVAGLALGLNWDK